MSIVNYRGLDENSISVPCAVPGCDARVVGNTHCHLHGGTPQHEWRTDHWGHTEYIVKKGASNGNDV